MFELFARAVCEGIAELSDLSRPCEVMHCPELRFGTTTRSTRVRTLDRTVVSVPNGQMASMTLENFAFRDWFWFHHMIGLRYETTLPELSSVLSEIRDLLTSDVRVAGRDWLRVRLLGFRQSGFEIEMFAYGSARDWPHFLEVQEELLLKIMALAHARGAPHRAIADCLSVANC